MLRAGMFAVAVLLGSIVFAANPIDSAVHVVAGAGRFINHGSGSVLAVGADRRVFIVTNAHVVRESNNLHDSIVVHPVTKPSFKIDYAHYVGQIEGGDDIAIVSGISSDPPPAIELNDHDPATGDHAVIVGFPKGGPMEQIATRTTSRTFADGSIAFDRYAKSGMSGGPVFVGGRLAAMLHSTSSSREEFCLAVPMSRIRDIFARLFPSWAVARQTARQRLDAELQVNQTGCPPGVVCEPQINVPQNRVVPVIPRVVVPEPPISGAPPLITQSDEYTRPVQPAMPPPPAQQRAPSMAPETVLVGPKPTDRPVAVAVGETEPGTSSPWPAVATLGIQVVGGLFGIGIPAWAMVAYRAAGQGRRAIDAIKGRRRSADDDFFRR